MKIFNKKLKKKIVEELEYLDQVYFQFDEPIPFKEGLLIYPVNVKSHDEFLACTACLTLNKLDDEEHGGKEVSHLDYLIYKMSDEKEGKTWARYFSRICELIFHIKNGVKCKKCGKTMTFYEFAKELNEKKDDFCCECGSLDFEEMIKYHTNEETQKKELIVNSVTINSDEYDRLRQIVMYQNLPDYKDDSWVDKEVREDQAETARLRAKKNGGNATATLERKIVCIAAATGYKIEDLYNLSIRKFLILLSAVDDKITYETTRLGLMTGMVSSKDPIEHWIYKKEERDIYGAAVDLNTLTNKINNAGQS